MSRVFRYIRGTLIQAAILGALFNAIEVEWFHDQVYNWVYYFYDSACMGVGILIWEGLQGDIFKTEEQIKAEGNKKS